MYDPPARRMKGISATRNSRLSRRSRSESSTSGRSVSESGFQESESIIGDSALPMSPLQVRRLRLFSLPRQPKMASVNPKRIVITGMGAVSPNGIGVDAFAAALAAGESGISALEGINTSGLKSWAAAAVKDFD